MITSAKNKAMLPIRMLTRVKIGAGTVSNIQLVENSTRGTGAVTWGSIADGKAKTNMTQIEITAGTEPNIAVLESPRFLTLGAAGDMERTSDTIVDALNDINFISNGTMLGAKRYEEGSQLIEVPFVLFPLPTSDVANMGIKVAEIVFIDFFGKPTEREVYLKAYNEVQGMDEPAWQGGDWRIIKATARLPEQDGGGGGSSYYIARSINTYNEMSGLSMGYKAERLDKGGEENNQYKMAFDLSKHKDEPLIYTNAGLMNIDIEHEVKG